MAGYSKKPLAQKLGLREGMRFHLANAPSDYARALEAPKGAKSGPLAKDLRSLPRWKSHLALDGMLWLSWAKKSSPLFAGLTDMAIREAGLAAGLVDIKVCAVSDDWSGLKFVYRLKDR